MSRLTKRNDGRFCVTLTDGYNPETGKPVRRCFYGETQKEAKQKRDEFLAARNAGLQPGKVPSVAEWAAKWLTVYGGGGGYSMKQTNQREVNRLVSALGRMPLDKVKRSDIKVYADGLSGMSFSTVQKARMVTQQVFREAVADRLIAFDPTMGVDWDYGSKGTHRALTDAEIATITTRWREHRFGLMVLLMLYTGLRRGEVLALTWGDIDKDTIHVNKAGHFEGNDLVVEPQTKTEAGMRDVPIISGVLREALRECKGFPAARLADSCTVGGRMTYSAWVKGWKTYGETLGLELRAHDLRHTYATMLYEAKVDMKTAQYLMGHADEKMIMEVYAHLRDNLKAESIDRLKALFG